MTYKAFTVAEDGTELEEVTGQTDFSIDQGGPVRQGATCTPANRRHAHRHRPPPRPDQPTVEGTAPLQVTDPEWTTWGWSRAEADRAGRAGTYKAFTVAEDGTELEEVTGQTDFSIDPGAELPGATSHPATAGTHTVTGRLRDDQPTVEGTAPLQVTDRPSWTTCGWTGPQGADRAGQARTYKAFAVAEDGTELEEVTGQTDFSIDQRRDCAQGQLHPGQGRHAHRHRPPPRPPAHRGGYSHPCRSPTAVDHLRLEPDPRRPIQLGGQVTYQAFTVAEDGTRSWRRSPARPTSPSPGQGVCARGPAAPGPGRHAHRHRPLTTSPP